MLEDYIKISYNRICFLVLTRSIEDGVGMKDLDQLQQDFENLLSTCAVRYRILKTEADALDRTEERKDKRGKFIDKVLLSRLNF